MPDIFDEIEEELRAERTRQFLTRYAGAILAAALLVVALVAGWQGWRWYQARQDQAAAATYIQAMVQADDTGKDATAAHAAALALWNEVAADASVDPLLRGLAGLLWTQHQIDTGDPGILESRLRPLAVPENPWHTMAEEQLALLAVRQGKTAEAKQMLTALTRDGSAPNGVRQRATAVLAQLAG